MSGRTAEDGAFERYANAAGIARDARRMSEDWIAGYPILAHITVSALATTTEALIAENTRQATALQWIADWADDCATGTDKDVYGFRDVRDRALAARAASDEGDFPDSGGEK